MGQPFGGFRTRALALHTSGMTAARRDPHNTRVDMYVRGRRVLAVEDLAARLGKSPSSVRSTIYRHKIPPAGYVTKNVPVYYPEQLGIEEGP